MNAIITAGGTGGHIYPALAIINKIKENYSVETLFSCFLCFLIGLTIGFIISPAKKGIIIGSYNGCNNKVIDSNKVNKGKNKSDK